MGARFSAPVQTGPEAHPAYFTMGTGSFPGIKRPGRGVDHPPQSSAKGKERIELHIYSPSEPSWPVLGWTLRLSLPLPGVHIKWENNVIELVSISSRGAHFGPGVAQSL